MQCIFTPERKIWWRVRIFSHLYNGSQAPQKFDIRAFAEQQSSNKSTANENSIYISLNRQQEVMNLAKLQFYAHRYDTRETSEQRPHA